MITILVLEDLADIRRLFVAVLSKNGFNVLEAATPAEAREVVDGAPHAVHLLVANVVLPGISGPRFARELSSANPTLRVLFVSGTPPGRWSDSDFKAMADLPVGSHAFLAKPFRPAELVHRVRELLGSQP